MFMGLGLFCWPCPNKEPRLTPGGSRPGGISPGGSSPGGRPKFMKGGGGTLMGLFLSEICGTEGRFERCFEWGCYFVLGVVLRAVPWR